MKKLLSILGTTLCVLIGVPILILVCIGYLLYVPFDIISYHRMPYYKDLKTKYEFFITSRDVVKIYNRIVREKLAIEYVKNNEYEYFVKDSHVLLCGWGYDGFEQVDGEWFFILDGEEDNKMAMKEALGYEIEMLKPEHRQLSARFLVSYDDITDAEKFEQARECPYFHCIFSMDEELV